MESSKNKNLFIIFGTTRGIGLALYEHASNFEENYFVLINRKPCVISRKNIYKKLSIDLSKTLTQNNILNLRKLFLQVNGFKNVYLVLNASIIDPIKPIGLARDKLLLEANHANFLNYERIINIFIESTRLMKAKRKILALSSGAAQSPHFGISSYCATKAALEMFFRCLYLEQKKQGKVLAIALRPGVVDTDMQKQIRSSAKKNFPHVAIYKKMFKQKKLLDPKIVARKIYSLLSSDSYWDRPIISIDGIK